MKFFTTLLSASMVAVAIGGQVVTPMQVREEGLLPGFEAHVVRRYQTHSLTGAAGKRMMRKRSSSKKCKTKSKSKKGSSSSSKSKSSGSSSSEKGTNNDSDDSEGSSSSTESKSSSGSSSTSSGEGLEGMTFSGKCKDPNASSTYPNGDLSFLNCGISKSSPKSKWTPPNIKMKDIKTVSTSEAAKSSTFSACSKYSSEFSKAESSTGVPAVMLMAFAMQESSCNPKEVGGNGEVGMMQLTPDKCKSSNCYDAGTNIMLGAKYFKSQIEQYDGNVLEAIGAYNGWSTDMSYSSATNQQYGCHSQNNLDYLNQFLNGWCQGKDGYSKSLLVYNNLKACSD